MEEFKFWFVIGRKNMTQLIGIQKFNMLQRVSEIFITNQAQGVFFMIDDVSFFLMALDDNGNYISFFLMTLDNDHTSTIITIKIWEIEVLKHFFMKHNLAMDQANILY